MPATSTTVNNSTEKVQIPPGANASKNGGDPSDGKAPETESPGRLADESNTKLIEYMCQILQDNRDEAKELRKKQRVTYWFLIGLSTLMFLAGLAMITAPLWIELLKTTARFKEMNWAGTAVMIGIGVADLIALYQLKPLARIQKLMGDMSQMTVAFSSFQTRVALRLLETDIEKRETVGEAAVHVGKIAKDTLPMVEKYFEKWLDDELEIGARGGSD